MRFLAAVASLLALLSAARADVVTLKNGAVYEGAVLEDAADAVTFQSDGIAWTFRRTNIARLERDAKTRDREIHPESVRPAVAPASKAKVVLYGTSWCGWCRRARAYFSEKGIAFEDKDVERDPAAAGELARLRQRNGIRSGGVPVIDVGGTVIVGFDQQRIDAALARR